MREVILYECAKCGRQWDNGEWEREATQGFPHFAYIAPPSRRVYDETHTPASYISVSAWWQHE